MKHCPTCKCYEEIDSAEFISLKEIVSRQIVPLGYDALRKARQRDSQFPKGILIDRHELKYNIDEIIQWYTIRLLRQMHKPKEYNCVYCPNTFIGFMPGLCDSCKAVRRMHGNHRRALKMKAQIEGPVSRAAYIDILNSGPCVYCGDKATHVDHIRPLARGGYEHESNLVPACAFCNISKNARLLTEWDRSKVEYACMREPKVAAEYKRQMDG